MPTVVATLASLVAGIAMLWTAWRAPRRGSPAWASAAVPLGLGGGAAICAGVGVGASGLPDPLGAAFVALAALSVAAGLLGALVVARSAR